MKKIFIIPAIILAGCSTIIPSFISKKKGIISTKEEAMEANRYFWDNFHAGNYDSIPNILNRLTATYLKDQTDYQTAAHIGFTHVWALTERSRIQNPMATVTDHAHLAKKYFEDACNLNPNEDRYYGFRASMHLTNGVIDNNSKETVRGYFMLKKAVRKYPEFNLFTMAYTLGNSSDPKNRQKSIDMLWKNIDACVGEKVNRDNFDYQKYMSLKTQEGRKRTCWNSWIAPHNLEGFLLIMGEMMLKNNDPKRALMIFKNIRHIEEYGEWAYKNVNENYIEVVEKSLDETKPLIKSNLKPFDGCMVCHQEKKLSTPTDIQTRVPIMKLGALFQN